MLRKDTVDMKIDPKERYTQKMGYHKPLRMVHMSKFNISMWSFGAGPLLVQGILTQTIYPKA